MVKILIAAFLITSLFSNLASSSECTEQNLVNKHFVIRFLSDSNSQNPRKNVIKLSLDSGRQGPLPILSFFKLDQAISKLGIKVEYNGCIMSTPVSVALHGNIAVGALKVKNQILCETISDRLINAALSKNLPITKYCALTADENLILTDRENEPLIRGAKIFVE